MNTSNGVNKTGLKIYSIVLSGNLGSGKSTAAYYLEKKFGFQHLSFVEEIWKPILVQRGLPFTRHNLQQLGIELMKDVGPLKLIQILLSKADPRKIIVIDDVRCIDVIDLLKQECKSIFLVYIQADFETRFPRLVKRDNIKNKKEQIDAESVETETTIPKLKKIADLIIVNQGSINEFYEELNRVENLASKKFSKQNENKECH